MFGAIAGDIVGSRFEGAPSVPAGFELFHSGCRFTDDTVCTLSIADALMNGRDFADNLRSFCRRHPMLGYGAHFHRWVTADQASAYGSWANGAPMRVAPVGWLIDTAEDVLLFAEQQAAVTHNHPDAIQASQAVAIAIFLARSGRPKDKIKRDVAEHFSYDLSSIPTRNGFDLSARGTVQRALVAVLSADDWETAVRRAIMPGGDTDTVACIAGAIAEALYGMPEQIVSGARLYLTADLGRVASDFASRTVIT